MPRFFALLLTALFLLPTTARAQSEPTLRFDLAVGVLAGSAQSERVSAVSVAPALTLDLGAQLGDHAAVFARLEGGTILFANEGAAYLISEWTPHPVISLGTGIGYAGMSDSWIGGSAGPAGSIVLNSWSGVSVPFVLGFNVQRRPAAGGTGEPNHDG